MCVCMCMCMWKGGECVCERMSGCGRECVCVYIRRIIFDGITFTAVDPLRARLIAEVNS